MKMSKRGHLLVLSGPSGVGKGTVLGVYLAQHPQVHLSVSATTRAPRPGEENGVHYYFLSQAQFEEKIACEGMLEWAQYNNHYYGTPREQVENILKTGEDVLLEIEVQGALKVKKAFPEAVLIFIMPPDFQTLRARLTGRGTEDAQTVQKRLETAVQEMACAPRYDFIIVNRTVDKAAADLAAVVEAAGFSVLCNQNFISEVYEDAKTHINSN
jgi:guanylate kinase